MAGTSWDASIANRAIGAATQYRSAASTLAAQADVVLTTAAREVPFRTGALASRTAQMLVVDCLFTGVALATYDRSMAALKRTFAAIEETESARTVRSSRRRRREEQQ